MDIWFEGSDEIPCSIGDVKSSLLDLGVHYVGVVSLMPGLSTVELVEQGEDYVVIKTNEGLMRRTNISRAIGPDCVVLEFDEEYQAGTKMTATSHYVDEFVAHKSAVVHRTTISGVEASGFLGFFYRHLGSSNIGRAVLKAYNDYLTQLTLAAG